jgi:hypothetical protein
LIKAPLSLLIYALLFHKKKIGYTTNLIGNKRNLKRDFYNNFLKDFKKDLRAFCNKNNNIEGIKIFKKDINKIFTRSNFGKLLIIPKFYDMSDIDIKKVLDNLNLSKYSDLNIKKEIVDIINKILKRKYKKLEL